MPKGWAVEKVALVILTALECAHFFSAYMPSYFTIKTFARTQDGNADIHMADLRSGYYPAIAMSIAIGTTLSIMIDNYVALLACLLVDAFMIGTYEYAMRY